MSEKRFPPTAKRLRDARRDGEVAHSRDVSSTLVFVVLLAVLWAASPWLLSSLDGLWRDATEPRVLGAPGEALLALLQHAATLFAAVVGALALLAFVAGTVGSGVQVGGLAAWRRLAPKLSRLNPAQHLQRVFSAASLVELAKLLLKTLLLGGLLLAVGRAQLHDLVRIGWLPAAAQLQLLGHVALVLCGWAAVISAALAALDLVHQRHEFLRRLRMSIEDLRREQQESEGHPLIQGQRRGEHREAVFAGPDERVRRSTLLVVAQDLAIGLQYLREDEPPRLVARGEGAIAEQLRRHALARGLYIEVNPTLAARLAAEASIDGLAPPGLHDALRALLARALGRPPEAASAGDEVRPGPAPARDADDEPGATT